MPAGADTPFVLRVQPWIGEVLAVIDKLLYEHPRWLRGEGVAISRSGELKRWSVSGYLRVRAVRGSS